MLSTDLPQTAFMKTIKVNQFDAEMFIAHLNSCLQIAEILGEKASINYLKESRDRAINLLGLEAQNG